MPAYPGSRTLHPACQQWAFAQPGMLAATSYHGVDATPQQQCCCTQVGVSALSGAGMDDFFEAVKGAAAEYKESYLPDLERMQAVSGKLAVLTVWLCMFIPINGAYLAIKAAGMRRGAGRLCGVVVGRVKWPAGRPRVAD